MLTEAVIGAHISRDNNLCNESGTSGISFALPDAVLHAGCQNP